MRILIIDDDPNYGQAMTYFLTAKKHGVQRILDSKIAPQRFTENFFLSADYESLLPLLFEWQLCTEHHITNHNL